MGAITYEARHTGGTRNRYPDDRSWSIWENARGTQRLIATDLIERDAKRIVVLLNGGRP
jgi:hypothetical protein